ncbi:MAG: replication-associated recombination protein A [Candidatus Ratteibacteria bacterium]|jgi:putative ATPase|nr:replication-associated recombination protein A [Patescibacteria group bacterium]
MKPLAFKIRPEDLNDFVGQEHLVGEGKPLRLIIEKGRATSFILWGPPGSGKTTLAKIYLKNSDALVYELSAVSASKKEVQEIIREDSKGDPKILFLDEIHRFNKAQQDFLLPFIESGEIFLVGSTTENPSFEVIPALLSRCLIFLLKPLSEEELIKIIDRLEIEVEEDAKEWLAEASKGDARRALGLIENAYQLYNKVSITTLKEAMQAGSMAYGKRKEGYYNTISAFIKSMRASQPDAALHYLARMIESGEDPKLIARRMIVFASEDIGMAQPTALVVANEVFRAVESVGLPEASINLAHGTVYLSLCKKDRSSYIAYKEAISDIKRYGDLPIPPQILNPTGRASREAGYGEGYDPYTKDSLLPDKIKNRKYFKQD